MKKRKASHTQMNFSVFLGVFGSLAGIWFELLHVGEAPLSGGSVSKDCCGWTFWT